MSPKKHTSDTSSRRAAKPPARLRAYDGADDSQLLTWLQTGDTRALETLLARYERPLEQFLMGILHDSHQAEDVLQETWCRTLQHLDSIAMGHLRGWLFTVAYHQAMLVKRRQKGRSAALPAKFSVMDPDPGPELAVQHEEDVARLRALLDGLPPHQREVIFQRVYEGKRFRDIAATLECPLNTALARMHEGIKKLKLLWGPS